ncbi:MAG: nuclear transport factor 2 family protein [Zoogloea sp.]|nr:nuclear transport factor 2 family protein [Zoogloea sp.]
MVPNSEYHVTIRRGEEMDFDSLGLGGRLGVVFGTIFVSTVVLSSVVSDWSKAQQAAQAPEAVIQAQPSAAGPAPASATPTAAEGAAAPSASERAERELKYLVTNWRNAWASRDIAAYLAFYAPEFQGNTDSPEHWRANRQRIIGQAKSIEITVGEANIKLDGDDLATVTFPFQYASDRLKDHGTKMLQAQRKNGQWLIENESFVAN